MYKYRLNLFYRKNIMSFIIREGQIDDMPSVMKLIHELAVFEKLPNEVELTTEDLSRDGFSDQPKFKTFVAVENDTIIGATLFYERYSTWKGRIFHLEDLIVTKEKRGTGVGMALYKAVLQHAFDHKAKRVSWDVLSWNSPAKDFYKSTGADILEDWQVVHMTEYNLSAFLTKK